MRLNLHRRVPPKVAVLALAAAVNLGVGIGLALSREHSSRDLRMVYDWCHRWLVDGVRLYPSTSNTDYPPNAIVFFAPIALVPFRWLVPVWTALTFALTPLLAFFVLRASTLPRRLSGVAAVTLAFCCWGAARPHLQFTRACLTLAFASLAMADTRPRASGVCLGLALAKPHIAGPIALCTLLTKRVAVVAIAAVVVAVSILMYDLRVWRNPLVTIGDYMSVLRSMYGGSDALVGRTSIRPWIAALVPGARWDDMAWIASSGALGSIPVGMAVRETRMPASKRTSAVPAMFCLWSLLSVFHLGHNLVLALPAFAFLALVVEPSTLWIRRTIVGVMQLVMMCDVPIHLAPLLPSGTVAAFLAAHADRFVMLLAYGTVFAVWKRLVDAPVRILATN